MSGLGGIFAVNQNVEFAALKKMQTGLSNRGLDGGNIFIDGSVGMVQTTTWVTPESQREVLPYQLENLVIVSDARIDNREELISLLGLPHSASDSEMILAAYRKWKFNCPGKLLGDFAFAIWDQAEKILFCVRDYFGLRPFYYFWNSHFFIFASEIRPILISPDVPADLDEFRIADHLIGVNQDKENTFYAAVKKLPPASCAVLSQDNLKIQSYWALDISRETILKSDQDYADRFRELFDESVKARLRSVYPVGSLLSGGLDSSSIVSVARNFYYPNGNGLLQTYSFIFDHIQASDERDYIQQVLAQGKVASHFIHGDEVSPFSNIEKILACVEEPFYAPNFFLNWAGWSAMQQDGVRTVLDGFLGDNVVSHGTAYLNELARSWRLLELTKEIRPLAKLYGYDFWPMMKHYLWHDALKPRLPGSIKKVWRKFHVGGQKNFWVIPEIVHPELAEKIDLLERIKALTWESSQTPSTARLAQYRELISGDIPLALETVNKGSAHFAIDPRYPFLDLRLVEYCLSLPPQQKLHQGWNRIVMRRALDKTLPEKIQWRSGKGNFSPNFRSGLLNRDRDFLDSIIWKNDLEASNYINVTALKNIYNRCLQGVANDDEVAYVWLSVLLEVWLCQLKSSSTHFS